MSYPYLYLELFLNCMRHHTPDFQNYEERMLVCLHSVYPVLIKMYYEMKYIMNSVYNEVKIFYSFS